MRVGVDSQCLSYLIDILNSTSRVSQSVAAQQLALIRIYFYGGENFWVTPTVKSECSKIRNNVYAELHAGFINTLFGCLPLNNPTVIEARSNHLFMYHRKKNDCRVLAEAEDLNFTVLLTFDTDLKNRLAVKANNVRLMKPTEFWAELSVPHNAKPLLLPHYTNPLSKQSFWRW